VKLRKAQLEAFSEPQLKEFEEFMVGHLRKWFPRECKALREEETRRRIRQGVTRAEEYAIVGRRDVCKFIDLMFALGPKFDDDAARPWARRILDDEDFAPSTKVDRLVQAALEHRQVHPPAEDA
jgi:hypothetical protein